MSDRILIMTAAPGRVDREIDIDLARPRDPTSDSFLRFRGETLEHLHFAGKAADLSA
jgi:ABC-type nitrate/sulfonate/bicarbonate transport system ATPase subunit